MDQVKVPSFRDLADKWSQEIALLQQNHLLGESAFISFARDRGLTVRGIIKGEPGDFHREGSLTSDGTDYDGGPLFHPLRIYPLHKILSTDEEPRAASTPHWNEIVDLAILLEPVYWPDITDRLQHGELGEREHRAQLAEYARKAHELIKTLDPTVWKKNHESLRIDAARMDENSDLYVLLRLASWDRRAALKGRISGALWIRHLAEIVRRGFEKVHEERWPEEDQAFGRWLPGGRERVFGSDRPLDVVLASKPYLAYRFGLFTGSAVRWYVEGETEFHAVAYILDQPAVHGVELKNLRGAIRRDEQKDLALILQDLLKQDIALKRFTMISFDGDEPKNVKTIRQQCKEGNVVGLITCPVPDFEFANFTVAELAEIAAMLDEADGFAGDPIRKADWIDVKGAKNFEKKYAELSATKCSTLKGKKWGEALAAYVLAHPRRSDNGSERPLWRDTRTAMYGWNSNYDLHKELFMIDCSTFQQIPRGRDSEKITG